MNPQVLTPEEVRANLKQSVDSGLALVNVALVSVERLTALNLEAGRAALENVAALVRGVLAAKDAASCASLVQSYAQPSFDKAVAHARSAYEIVTQAGDDASKLVESRFVESRKAVALALEQAAKSAPVGSDAALQTVKQVLSAADAAYANLNMAVKQATAAAEANVVAATKATLDAVANAGPKALKLAA
ncbi:MAG: phasin family protein [Rhodocyclaceae bacterium]|nr:phasin family protein [Rhodocyclaceae bacterium]MBX3667360.1 phasin family protein [Rhodocyclaceae bacterium]